MTRVLRNEKAPLVFMTERADNADERPSREVGSVEEATDNFRDFDEKEWRGWLTALLIDEPLPPHVALDKEEWHQTIFRVFSGLEAKVRVAFNQALFEVFEQTSILRKNERQLYTLLHVICYAVPDQAKQLLRRRLRERVFRGLSYKRQDLHSLLLLACSKYHVDEALAKYVQRSARASKDYDYLLLCQQVLATIEDSQAFYFNERLLPLINSPQEAAAAARQLTSISKRLGYSCFLDWYKSRSYLLQTKWGERWEFFADSLRARLLSDRALPALAVEDPDAVLLYAELRIAQDLIPVDTVLKIARLNKLLGVEETTAILNKIWKDLYERTGDPPWDYVTSEETRGTLLSGRGKIYRVREYSAEPVAVTTEPETEKVLVEVRKYTDSLIPKEIGIPAP